MPWRYISQRRQVLYALTSRMGKTALIYPAAFLAALGGTLMMLGIIFFARETFGATPTQIGVLSATWAVSYAFGCLFLRPLSQRMLPRYSMLAANSLLFGALTWMAMAPSLWHLYAAYAAGGAALAFFWPASAGWISTNVEGKALGRSIGWFNVAWSFGSMLGPLLTGWLSTLDPALPIRVAAIVYLVNAAMILGGIITLSRLGEDDEAHRLAREPVNGDERGTPLRFPGWVGVFAGFFGAAVIFTIFPLSARQDLGLSKTVVGWLFMIRAATTALWMGVLPRSTAWHYRRWPMVAGTLLTAGLLVAMSGARSAVSAGILLAALGLMTAHNYTEGQFHGVAGAKQRATRMAIHEALVSAGIVFGSIFGGLVYDHGGFVVLYIATAALLLLAAGIQLTLMRRAGGLSTGTASWSFLLAGDSGS